MRVRPPPAALIISLFIMHETVPLHVVAVFGIIQKEHRYLIAKRSEADDQSPGVWAFPGRKVEMLSGTNVIEKSIKREIREEIGIQITNNIHYLGSNGFVRSSGHHVIGLLLLCEYKSGVAAPLEGHTEIKWVTIKEAEQMNLHEYMMDSFHLLKKYLTK
jgi:8-oxo-dGTP diphosphatase